MSISPMNLAASLTALLFFLLHTATADPVHDILPQYGLPKGLVPDSVTSYSLADDGKFEIQLAGPCYLRFDELVYYKKKITGKLSYGSITNLKGIQAQKLFLWVSVTGIKVLDSNEIEFDVGVLSETLSAEQFETVRKCSAKPSRADLLLGTSLSEVARSASSSSFITSITTASSLVVVPGFRGVYIY